MKRTDFPLRDKPTLLSAHDGLTIAMCGDKLRHGQFDIWRSFGDINARVPGTGQGPFR